MIATDKSQSQRLLACGVSADTADMIFTPHNTLSTEPYKEALKDTPTEMLDKFPPMEMYYDPKTMTARVIQNMCFRINQEVVDKALKIATDKQLRAELKRRADERIALKGEELRCRNCKHCIEGYTSKRSLDYGCKTSVCAKKVKFQCEAYALYYVTIHSKKACEMFELK